MSGPRRRPAAIGGPTAARRWGVASVTLKSDLSAPPAAADDGLAELSARLRQPLMAYFRRRTADAAEAEDLTQEVFIRALRREGETDVRSADAYVFTIAANLMRDRARRRAARSANRHVSLDPLAPRGPHLDLPAEDSSAESVLIDRERLRLALAALEELPERTRHVFILFRVEKMRQAEIADRLGISVSAVEKHVVRAAAHLARRIR
ncbi:MAG: sigma-70 family RNA polymerase sigma factor [Phenylobacterium sp.]|nr:sigma-70 family RNA polymerase sigma factor [Phenylobacterium sp.]